MRVGDNFVRENHPVGPAALTCIDIIDQGMQPTGFGPKHMVKIVFVSEHAMEDGRPFYVSIRFNATLNPKGRLRPFLEAWRGRKFTVEEARDFDLDVLLGKSGLGNITNDPATDGSGKVWDNIVSIMPLRRGERGPDVPADYVRVQDRPQQEQPAARPQPAAVPAVQRSVPQAATPGRNLQGRPAIQTVAATGGYPQDEGPDDEGFPPSLEDEDDDLPF